MSLLNIDRRIIYALVFFALAIPLSLKYSVTPARMASADKMFDVIEATQIKPGDIAFVSLDFGPNTTAENGAQAEVVIEHLLRKHIPFALFSQYVQGASFLNTIPEEVVRKLSAEDATQRWSYGKDWVNLGYKPNAALLIQSIPKSTDLVSQFKKDAKGNSLSDLPVFKNVRTLENIALLVQITGLTGTLETYMQFFQKENYRPTFLHGCTSIAIPKSYIYMDSGQLKGFLEGIAGAAWYSMRLQEKFPNRSKDKSVINNTGLGVAHLVIIVLIILGNISGLLSRKAPKTA